MTDLILSLPGDIPGLLRRGSPVLGSPFTTERRPCVVVALVGGMATIDYGQNVVDVPTDDLALDLTDPTGRTHAAWWARSRLRTRPDNSAWDVMGCGVFGADMTPEQIDTLARLVLRLAGRSHA